MKKIIICLDGTWNKPSELESDTSESNGDTNIYRLYKLIKKNDINQITYYDEGVGTKWYDSIIGGVTGVGLSENIIQAYDFLSHSWQPGDQVFLFGFSRGAYTARSLAGMIYSCGLCKPVTGSNESLSSNAFNVYKYGDKEERNSFKSQHQVCPIDTIGVWDTVGALGIPLTLLKGINSKLFQFHDTKINKEVKYAFHALALDEQRETFTPTLWNESELNDGQTIEQVWFSGVHSDIGGGYKESYYSDITLKWMINKIMDRVIFSDENYVYSKDSSQEIHDSYKVYFGGRISRSLPVYDGRLPFLHRSVVNCFKKPSYNCLALSHLINKKTLSPYRVVD